MPDSTAPSSSAKRRMTFRVDDERDALSLTDRLMREGISVDRIPQVGYVRVKAVADPEKHAQESLAEDMARGLRVEIEEDVVA